MKRHSPALMLSILFVVGLSLGVLQAQNADQPTNPLAGLVAQASPVTPVSNQQIEGEMGAFARLAKALKPSVVGISIVKENRRGPFPFARSESEGSGSGVIVSPDGEVVTNNHVVENASDIRVQLQDGRTLKAAVIGTDPKTDLALLKVDAQGLPAAALGDSETLQVGDWVMAIGNPFGLEATVTVGVLSGKGRVIGAGPYDDFLQTDASINPGNSGGPLFNTAGEVVGINTAIIRGGQGIGFSIPIDLARYVLAQLRDNGQVVRGFVGLGIQSLSPQLKEALDLPDDLEGALVSSVLDGGPAAQAGAKVQDVVTAINGAPVRSDRELLDLVARTPVGSLARLTVFRNGRQQQLEIEVGQRPDEQVSFREESSDDSPRLGVRVRDLDPDLAAQLGTKNADGILVVDVLASSPARRAGVRPGDIIRKLGNQPVQNADDFVAAVNSSQGALALLLERQGQTIFVVVEE